MSMYYTHHMHMLYVRGECQCKRPFALAITREEKNRILQEERAKQWTEECKRLRIHVNKSSEKHQKVLDKIEEIRKARVAKGATQNVKVTEQRDAWTKYIDSSMNSIWSTSIRSCSDERILELLETAKKNNSEFSLDETN